MANNGKRQWVKWLLVVLALGGAIAGGVWYFKHGAGDTPDYQSVTVARGDLTQMVTATGQLNPVVNVQVGSQISGIILKLFADFNSPVKAGQVIAQLDPATYQANVHSSEGDLANARAGFELAQVDARRAESLFKDKLIAQSEFDRAMATLHQAEAQVKIKEAALERAKVDFERCTILAPVDGIVISRNVDVGQTVAASLSAPTIFVIANDLTKMQIDANVAEADIGGVEVGQDADFSVDAFPTRTFRGKVTQVRNSPIMVQNVVSYDTVIAVSNPELKLKPGMTANVSIIIARRERAVKIPNAALRFKPPEVAAAEIKTNVPAPQLAGNTSRGGGGRAGGISGGTGNGGRPGGGAARARGERSITRTVYVLPGGGKTPAAVQTKLEPVQIKVGISDGVNTEVIEGLKEGDVVVTAAFVTGSQSASRTTNPFGGGMRRF